MKQLAAICALAFAGASHAMTGNELDQAFKATELAPAAAAYTLGAFEATNLWMDYISATVPGRTPLYCVPNGVTNTQAVDIVKRHLVATPATRHLAASVLVVTALKEAWPCKKP